MKAFLKYIDKTVENLKQEEEKLASTDRKDEANLVKVRINVYGICKTVYQVFAQNKEGKVLANAYLEKLDSLEEGWQASQKKAKEYDAVEKAVIEEIKLQAIADIRQQFLASGEEEV